MDRPSSSRSPVFMTLIVKRNSGLLKFTMDSLFTYFSICCCLVMSTDGVNVTLEMKSILPLKGSSLELSCIISEPFNSNVIVVWKGSSLVTICYADSYLCDFYKTGYSFTTNRTGVFGRISSLTTEAEGTWRCSYRTSAVDIAYSNIWNLIVYTIPSGLSITQNPNQNIDLSVQSVVLQCKTTGCTYPVSTVQWIFQDQTTLSEIDYITNNPTGMQETCTAQEKIYTSTLNLSMYTTLNDNSDKTGTFSCRIEYPDSSRNIIASASHTVRFAVRVTEIVLQQNNQNMTEILTVTSAEPVTLTCITGTSRPAPTIDWYTGSQKRGSGPSLTITFSNMDHNGTIYCQAYNIDSSKPVSSAKPRLFVQAAPKILDISQDYKGYVGQYIMIQFDFQSNMKENLTVTAQHSSSSGSITQGLIRPTLPEDLGDSPPVQAPDFKATLVISITRKSDFGQYEIKVNNSIGSDSESIRIIEQITPEKPINFHATNIQEKQLSLRWQSGYNGGYTQTFIVEISLDNITWTQVSEVSAGNMAGWFPTIIEDLIPGSEYYLRLYAYNINGRGDFADVQHAIKMLKECASSLEVNASVGIGIGGAVGVGVGGIIIGLVGAIIAFTIRRQLNGPKNSCVRRQGKTDDAMHTYSNTEMNPQTVKPIYEELNKGNTEPSVYDKISPL